MIYLLLILSLSLLKETNSFLPIPSRYRLLFSEIRISDNSHQATTSSLSAYLVTNFEWLAEERFSESAYIDWIDPSPSTFNSSNKDEDEDEDDSFIIPIYPIPAVYLPHGTHTLNNVEPRNLKMALDLNATSEKLFCVTLTAIDTGRVSKLGTLLRISDLKPTYNPNDNTLMRITVYCHAVGVVEICEIINPKAASQRQRLLRSPEYLKGRVVKRKTTSNPSLPRDTVYQMVRDFNSVKTMYQLGIWSHEMPPNALTNLASAMPTWTEEILDDATIWEMAQIWQSLCLTIREGRQQLLNSDRNELMVSAASKKGGPLKLPIHLEDLEPKDRRSVQDLEVQAQREFWKLEIEPCLDFLIMMSLDSEEEQTKWLANIISRERKRLELAAQDCTGSEMKEEEVQPNKGAWFDDAMW